MKNIHLSSTVCAINILLSLILLSDAFGAAEYVPGEVLVKFKNNSDSYIMNSLHSEIGSVKKKAFKKARLHHIRIPRNLSIQEAIDSYEEDPNVEYAEPNYIIHVNAVPNDSYFYNLWGLYNIGQSGGTYDADIDATKAWDITTGSSDVVIAVVDTGVKYTHSDLSGNIWRNTGETSCSDGIDNDGNGYTDDCNGWDFNSNDNSPMDGHGHGTHVAGIIAAVGNNSRGVTGVMWEAQIMPLQFMSSNGVGAVSDAVSAILYANENGADVINLSWGGSGASQILKDVIDASDAVVVSSAGNNGTNNDSATPNYPSNYTSTNIIAVAASDNKDNLRSSSNYGSASVDLAAPGSNIYSTSYTNSYTYKSGTSMATPHVSGVAGLILAENPGFTFCQVKRMILNGVDIKSSLSGAVLTGGRLNAYGALIANPGSEICSRDSGNYSALSGGSVSSESSGGGCFIATAAYGSLLHPYVKALREFRDKHLLDNVYGKAFVRNYYKYSPPLADVIRDHDTLRLITRVLLMPLVMFVAFPYTSSGLLLASLAGSIAVMGRLKKRRSQN